MTQPDASNSSDAPGGPAGGKKAYVKPRVESNKVFEASLARASSGEHDRPQRTHHRLLPSPTPTGFFFAVGRACPGRRGGGRLP